MYYEHCNFQNTTLVEEYLLKLACQYNKKCRNELLIHLLEVK